MKIYVTGPAWSGKSTLAKRLGGHYGVPVTHLDELLWNADWTENKNYGQLQREAISAGDWVIEWPSCSIVKSMPDVDLIVILDFPPLWNAWRILVRRLRSFFGFGRVWMTLPDRLNFALIQKTFTWRKRQLPRLMENIEKCCLGERVVALRDVDEAFGEAVARAVSGAPLQCVNIKQCS